MEKTPIDINKPVTNPGLIKAFQNYHDNSTDEAIKGVIKEIKLSNFLVAVMPDKSNTTISDISGSMEIGKGTKLSLLYCYNQNNESMLPIFSDWDEIYKWSVDKVNAIVMSSSEIWNFISNDKESIGVIINPGSIGWPLSKKSIKAIQNEE